MDEGGGGALAERADRRIADESIGEGEAVGEWPEGVRLEEVERLVQQRVSAPGDDPRLEQRILEIARDDARQPRRQGPGRRYGKQEAGERRSETVQPRIRIETSTRIAVSPSLQVIFFPSAYVRP